MAFSCDSGLFFCLDRIERLIFFTMGWKRVEGGIFLFRCGADMVVVRSTKSVALRVREAKVREGMGWFLRVVDVLGEDLDRNALCKKSDELLKIGTYLLLFLISL